jgi:methylenetetrahydrofolate reductase (NADPH)
MRTTEFFKKKTVLSFEVFPPKRTSGIETIYRAIDGLAELKPDFISVTYSAGGSKNSAATVEIASTIKNRHGIESVAHLTSAGLTKEGVSSQLREFEKNGIENILALRGDITPDTPPSNDFKYASDLASFINENGGFNILGACYPEGHQESGGIVNDIHNLKRKVDAGASHLVSQIFFDNQFFYKFRERADIAGIHVPIEAGIMPVVNKAQIERMVSLCGATLPDKFLKMMARYEHNLEAMRDAGIAYAVNQIVDLITQGVDGIHLYTMNNPMIAAKICSSISSLISAS